MKFNTWVYMVGGDDNHLYDEDGNKRPITTWDYTMPYGKYQGLRLSEIVDRAYLEWAQASNRAKKPMDWYFDKLVERRINELS